MKLHESLLKRLKIKVFCAKYIRKYRESYDVDLSFYDRIIFGFPVWAGTFTPPIRTFVTENKDALKGKKLAAFACQSGNGAEKAFIKLAKLIGTDSFDSTAVFVDPKAKPDEKKEAAIDSFCRVLKP